MPVQIIFNDNLDPSSPNLSDRFTDATAFFIAAPLINAEIEIDVYLQLYIPAQVGEIVRNIPFAKVKEQSILLNRTDSESMVAIPLEYQNTGLEMALLFIASSNTFLQATIIQPLCNISELCADVDDYFFNVINRLNAIEQAINSPQPEPQSITSEQAQQQNLFFR